MSQEHNEFLRMSKILDIFLKVISELEYELRKTSTERLKNEYHLLPEQRELELRQYLISKATDHKLVKLEHYSQLILEDLNLSEVNNRPGNETERFVDESIACLDQINQLVFEGTLVSGDMER